MDVDAVQAALLEQLGRRLDHHRRTSEIGLAAVELVEVAGDRLVHQAGAMAAVGGLAQHRREVQVGMPGSQLVEPGDTLHALRQPATAQPAPS